MAISASNMFYWNVLSVNYTTSKTIQIDTPIGYVLTNCRVFIFQGGNNRGHVRDFPFNVKTYSSEVSCLMVFKVL